MGGSGQGGSGGGSMGGAGGMAGDPGFPVVPAPPNMEERTDMGLSASQQPPMTGNPTAMDPGPRGPQTDAGTPLTLLGGEEPKSGCQTMGSSRSHLPWILLAALAIRRRSRRE